MAVPKRPRPQRWSPIGPAVLVMLDAAAERPLHRQVYDGLRDAVLTGRIAAGARLPSTRVLAGELGVSRNTVSVAYDQLRAEGYLVGRRGGGTRVRSTTPDALLEVSRRTPRAARALSTSHASSRVASDMSPRRGAGPRAQPVRLPARGAALVAAGDGAEDHPSPRAFDLGVPALDAFPARVWARLTARRWRRGAMHLGDGHVAGDPRLRAAIAEYVANARGVRCTADQILLTNGTLQGIDLVARVLLEAGDRVWVEDPGYLQARTPLVDAGAHLVPVPVDGEGLRVSEGERLAPRARLAYVTPSHQFPLGAVMSAPRRLALLAWARRAGTWIFEDDYDSEFRYGGRPLPSLQGMDVESRWDSTPPCVIYAGTFSKTLAPGLRLGYLVLPDTLVDPLRAARRAVDRFAPTMEQGVLTDFIGDGHYARHVRTVRTLYAERQDMLLHAASPALDAYIALSPDVAGLHLVGWLPEGEDDVAMSRAARADGVSLTSLSSYRVNAPPGARGALLLGYAGFDEREMRAGVRDMLRAFGKRMQR